VIITFEGGEGVGKTTQVALLCSYLDRKGISWSSIREPGGSPISEEIRAFFVKRDLHPITELLLILASRRENIRSLIEPAIADKKVVIIDRFIDSTFVYQGIAGGLDKKFVMNIMKLSSTYIEPDITFILDMNPEDAISRITPDDKFEHKPLRFHEMIRQAFLNLPSEIVPVAGRYYVIDASRTIEDVNKEILSVVEGKLLKKYSIVNSQKRL